MRPFLPDSIAAHLSACHAILAQKRRSQNRDLADPKDAARMAAAVREACPWLVAFNVRHFQPSHPAVAIVRPGEFVQHLRALLAYLSPGETS
jgi:hypothetical protein